jgi:hypothetical protein
MRSIPILLMLIAFLPLGTIGQAHAQLTTQTVRGTVIDADTRQGLPGATLVVLGSDPIKGTTTDLDGRFVITAVLTGRLDLQVRMLGFEEQRLSNLLLTSGKELVLEVVLVAGMNQLKEFEVTATERKEQARNDMATVSARRISVEETSRIAGGINDPARMVGTFAGVATDPMGNNTIVVRGNSPKGVQWRLEGMEIPNPNHFSDDGSTGGPINVLNSDMIDDSDFYTGAFGAEYGNVTSAVFDMRLRKGNDRKREYTLKAGVLGTDLTAEGPLPGVEGGSYLANYRYSTLALLDEAGIVDYDGVPRYTDAAFHLRMPSKALGTFSLFGIGGRSSISSRDEGIAGDTLFSTVQFGSRMGVLGVSNTRTLGANSFLYTTLALSGNGSSTDYEESPAPGEIPVELRHASDLSKWTVRGTSTFNVRITSAHKLRAGIIVAADRFRMRSDSWDPDRARLVTELDRRGSAVMTQAFLSWKWRWNEQWTMTSGVHVLAYDLNKQVSIEPRLALRYEPQAGQAFTFGAGVHAKPVGLMTQLVQRSDAAGDITTPNRDLGFSRAAHAVLGYERMLAEDVQFKAEVYYQHLFDMPVENDPTSSYSESNTVEWFSDRALVNAGVGYNRGVELALEKFFTRGYHFMATASLSDTRYKPLDGQWYNGRFNMGVVANALGDKEWKLGAHKGKDRVLMAGLRYSLQGGMYSTPIDLMASIAAGEQRAGGEAWSVKGDPIHKVDMVLSYRVGRPKVSHEFKVDVQNVLNADTSVMNYFNTTTERIEPVPQLAILPVLQYTLRF